MRHDSGQGSGQHLVCFRGGQDEHSGGVPFYQVLEIEITHQNGRAVGGTRSLFVYACVVQLYKVITPI